MTDPEFVTRIARWRRRRDRSQVAFAALVGWSESWLSASQVDRTRPIDAVADISSDEAANLGDASC
jgi:hypothetical protein